MNLLATALLIVAAMLLVIAAWGVVVLPDTLSRQHAATKAGTLALSFVCFGAAAAIPEPAWMLRLLLIAVFLIATLPVASHLLARAAASESDEFSGVAGSGDDPGTPGP